MVKICSFSEWFWCYTSFTDTLSNPHSNLQGQLVSHFMNGMLRDIRYLPKVTQLPGGMVGLQSRAASFQSSHYLRYLVGAGQTGRTTCKTSPSKAWLFSSPPANNTIHTGTEMEQWTPCSTESFIVGNLLSPCHQSALNNGPLTGLRFFSSVQSLPHEELAGSASHQHRGRRGQQASGLSWEEESWTLFL